MIVPAPMEPFRDEAASKFAYGSHARFVSAVRHESGTCRAEDPVQLAARRV